MARSRGFSLIDVIVGVALLLIVFVALMGTLRASLSLAALARAKSAMAGLAESQMEYLRGIDYSDLGTADGTPIGPVTDDATTTIDGAQYGVHTVIQYVDADDDYKVVEVTVTTYGQSAHSLSLVSNFAP